MSEQNRHNDQSEYYDHNVRVPHIDCTLTPPPAKNKELNKQMMKDTRMIKKKKSSFGEKNSVSKTTIGTNRIAHYH
jgi:hypothetical protein